MAVITHAVLLGYEAAVGSASLCVGNRMARLATLDSYVLDRLLRRFDLSSRFYLTAFACGVVGVTLGGLLGSGFAGASFERIRLVHAHLNLVGLVGLTIIRTPTVAHHRAVSGREASVAWWLSVSAVVLLVLGLVAGEPTVGAGTLAVGVAALLILGGVVIRLWERGRRKVPFLQVAAGVLWLSAWAIVDGMRLPLGDTPELARMAMLAGYPPAAIVLAAVWVLDFARRVAAVRR